MWMTNASALLIVQGNIVQKAWGPTLVLTALTVSMTVNALVTGLIVIRIFKVFREVKSLTTLEDKSLGITHGNKLRSVTFVIIESGMTLFAIQLARVIITATGLFTNAENDAYDLIAAIHGIFNVIISSVIAALY